MWNWAEYSTFSISDEVDKYRLTVDGYSGDAGDAMAASVYSDFDSNGRQFSTPESDNDICPCNCAADRLGGWWFGWCASSFLNYDIGVGVWAVHANVYVHVSRMLVKVQVK